MTETAIPLVLEPSAAASLLGTEGVRTVDLCKAESYRQGHLPGAVHLEYAALVAARPPAAGALPSDEQLGRALAGAGVTPQHHVIAYDDEGGGRAARLLWTLHVLGHRRCSLLDGGRAAWANAGLALDRRAERPAPGRYPARAGDRGIADKAYILARLGDPGTVLLDARSAQEYDGTKKRAEKVGHIPGAVNWEWTEATDPARDRRLRPAARLRATLHALGVTPDKEVVVYCHTHHRSALSFVVLRHLGFPAVRGYDGSWSEWGNSPDTPVA